MKIILYLTTLILFNLASQAQDTLRTTCTDNTPADIQTSIAFYNQRLLADSNSQVAYYKLGMCYYKRYKFDTAIQYFSRLILLNPNYTAAFSNRGLCKLLLKDKEGACSDFEQSIAHGQNPRMIAGKKLSKWRVN